MERFLPPPRWSADRLDAEVARAVGEFRRERVDEPVERYGSQLDGCRRVVEELLQRTDDLLRLRERAVETLADRRLLEAVRYLAGPAISQDDLGVLAEVSLSARALRDPETALKAVETVLLTLDRRRFPWLAAGRPAEPAERQAAVLASAVLMATERMRTSRRITAGAGQELAVAQRLLACGFAQVPVPRQVRMLEDAPGPGTFCGQTMLAGHRADLLIGLWDRRRMAVECKVSNSQVNSFKRVNNEAAAKAEAWIQDFGRGLVVPVAVLSGVFKRANLESAQERGLTLFWAHDLDEMADWIERTRTRGPDGSAALL